MLRSYIFAMLVWGLSAFCCAQAPDQGPDANKGEVMRVEYIGAYAKDDYLYGLLRKALQNTTEDYGPFEITATPPASHWRVSSLITSKPKSLRVAVTARPQEIRDRTTLRMLYVPLMRGAFGFRVCVTSKAYAEILEKSFNSGDLSNIRFGAGYAWSDVDILRYNGLRVTESGFDQNADKAISSLYKMTARQRVDAFCRGVNEILREQSYLEEEDDLVLNSSHVIVYDMPFFYMMHPDNTALFDRITQGLQRMLASGEWEKHWEEQLGESLRFTDLQNRKVIRLKTVDTFYDTEEYRQYLFF